jgi:hypothetical protein
MWLRFLSEDVVDELFLTFLQRGMEKGCEITVKRSDGTSRSFHYVES